MKVRVTVSEACDACGVCVETCPTDVFEVKGGEVVTHEERCIYCRGCEAICPKGAIKLSLDLRGLRHEVVALNEGP